MVFTEDVKQLEVEFEVEGSILLRVDAELMRIRTLTPILGTNKFRVTLQRGQRGTRVMSHAKDASVELISERPEES